MKPSITIIWILLFSIGEHAPRADGAPPAVDAESLRWSFLILQSRISSLDVSYRVTTNAGSNLDKSVIAQSPSTLRLEIAHEGPTNIGGVDFDRQQVFVDAAHFINFRPFSCSFLRRELAPDAPLPDTLSYDAYLFATGIWPLSHRPTPRPHGIPHMISDLAQSRDWNVAAGLESIRGRLCLIIDVAGGRERIYVDREVPACVVRRDLMSETSTKLLMRWELEEHRQVAAGVWLPLKVSRLEFSDDGNGKSRNPVAEDLLSVNTLAVNSATSNRSIYPLPSGALELIPISSPAGEPAQVREGGSDLLDHYSNWIQQVFIDRASRAERDILHLIDNVAFVTLSSACIVAIAMRYSTK